MAGVYHVRTVPASQKVLLDGSGVDGVMAVAVGRSGWIGMDSGNITSRICWLIGCSGRRKVTHSG